MKLYDIKEIKETVDFLYKTICGKNLTYEQTKDTLDKANIGVDFAIEIINDNEEQGFYDVDVGKMTFTIYKDGDTGFRICENATYYTYDTGSCVDCTKIDIEL